MTFLCQPPLQRPRTHAEFGCHVRQGRYALAEHVDDVLNDLLRQGFLSILIGQCLFNMRGQETPYAFVAHRVRLVQPVLGQDDRVNIRPKGYRALEVLLQRLERTSWFGMAELDASGLFSAKVVSRHIAT